MIKTENLEVIAQGCSFMLHKNRGMVGDNTLSPGHAR